MPNHAAEHMSEVRDLGSALTEAMEAGGMPDLKAVICAFMDLSGGPKGVAKMLRREYRDAKSGSMIRSMILQMILQGAKAVSAKEAPRDPSLITDDDLNRQLHELIAKGNHG